MSTLITACSTNESSSIESFFKQVDFENVKTYFNDGKEGFILLATDNDEYYIPTVKKIANEKNVQIIMYNPYQPNGKSDNEDGQSIWPEPSEDDIPGGGFLYYLKDNKVVGELEVNRFENSQLTIEVQNFLNLHKKESY
ncbi:hypothetical protein J2S19_003443 [Metabacillus malikii]|uniref:Uncharacterized protein n=2 Tax=Metabacillus malikii TaxID=1504265 RepID=A0ABT9ZIR0_9BACI|nr:hypothetical protein [Metabacillus malikii]